MSSTPRITCIGEVLVDFISTTSGLDLVEAPGFMKFAGGAAANVAVGLAKLGEHSAFVGKVGKDSFGTFLCNELRRNGVDVSGLLFADKHKTRLAFVSLTKSGDRDFEFWEQHPADEQFYESDISIKRLASSNIIHIGSFLLIREPSRSTTLKIAKELHRRSCIISFDPNLRLSLWKSPAEARRILLRMFKLCTILRLNEDEVSFITDVRDLERAARKLLSLGPLLVVVTRGAKGCYVLTTRYSKFIKGFSVNAVDTTGCGDGFLAGLLSGLVRSNNSMGELSDEELTSICTFANAIGAMTATKSGVIAALPTFAEVKRFLSSKQ